MPPRMPPKKPLTGASSTARSTAAKAEASDAIVFTKAQRSALANLPLPGDVSVERTNIKGAVAAVVGTGARKRVWVIASNGRTAEF